MACKVDNWSEILKDLEELVKEGGELLFDQAMVLAEIPDEYEAELLKIAYEVRKHFCSNKVDLCSIVNARSGRCAEDCKFCAQSSRHAASIPSYPMKSANEIVVAARIAEERGAHRFCVVTSGERLAERDFETALEAISLIGRETGLRRCASLGTVTEERASMLKQVGLDRYHHNLETCRSYFESVCTTHTYDDKLETISNLKKVEIETCVGGLLNLGESPRQRIEFAFELKHVDPVSVPVNFLDPRPGTPLEGRPSISSAEAAKYLAIYRLILPKAYIRLAGGRLETFRDQPHLPFTAGANALLIGDLLTTKGADAKSDLTMLSSLGLDISAE